MLEEHARSMPRQYVNQCLHVEARSLSMIDLTQEEGRDESVTS